ncbi:hypothetical protein TNCT_173721, partial [Trichonephila clavata]
MVAMAPMVAHLDFLDCIIHLGKTKVEKSENALLCRRGANRISIFEEGVDTDCQKGPRGNYGCDSLANHQTDTVTGFEGYEATK